MITFILNDKKITTDANPSMTLVDFIREERQLKGTKIVCREGDCGACTVLIGELESATDGTDSVKYHSITSCISPVANAQGKHVVTVEGVNLKHQLNRIQSYLKDHYASQCGFCTPGFVMAMTQYCLNVKAVTDQDMLDAISGNICRCTGYVSIIKAAKAVVKSAQNQDQKLTLLALIDQGFIPAYFENMAEQLQALNHQHVISGQKIIAGGTDLYVQQADDLLLKPNLRYITQEHGNKVLVENGLCRISGVATVTDLFDNAELIKCIPHLQEYLRLVSSEAIRNMATIAGNFVNASPIADMSVFLLALDAQLLIVHGDNSREVALKEFFLTYKKVDLVDNESIAKITFTLPKDNTRFHFQKVSKRKHLDIATVNTAICVQCDEQALIESVAITLGGVAPIPLLLNKTCDYLTGKKLTVACINQALTIMNKEIAPITDVRGTAQYKRFLANQLIKGHFIKLFPDNVRFEQLIDITGVVS